MRQFIVQCVDKDSYKLDCNLIRFLITEEEQNNGKASMISRELAKANGWNHWVCQFEKEFIN